MRTPPHLFLVNKPSQTKNKSIIRTGTDSAPCFKMGVLDRAVSHINIQLLRALVLIKALMADSSSDFCIESPLNQDGPDGPVGPDGQG